MKQPNWKIPLALAASLLILSSFAYWLQYSHKPKSERAETQDKKPLALPKEDAQIVQFRIKSAAGIIEGKCDSLAEKTCTTAATGKWSLTYPFPLQGDPDSIKDVLTNATTMTATETVDLKDETPEKRKALLEEYGLSDDKRTKMGTEFIELTLENGTKLTAWFGEPYPVGDKVFVGSTTNGVLNDKTIFIIANFYKGVFGKPITYFRNKTILDFNRSDISEINATTSTGKFKANLENGSWVINGKRGDYDRIETALSSISQSKAKEFPSPEVLKGARSVVNYEFKSKTNHYTYELFEKTSKPIKIKGHDEIPGESHYFVKASGLKEPVEVEAGLRGQIDKKVTELRYGLLLSETEKATATRMKIEGKNLEPALSFQYEGKVWVQKDNGPKMDVSRVAQVLDQLPADRASDIVSPAPPVPADALTVSIGDEKNPSKAHFVIYSIKDKNYAKDLNGSNSSNEAFIVTLTTKSAFPFNADSWKIKK